MALGPDDIEVVSGQRGSGLDSRTWIPGPGFPDLDT